MAQKPKHSGFSLATAGHVAHVAGFHTAGTLARSTSSIGIGSQLGAASLAGVGVALAGIAVAATLVEVGFKTLSETTMSLVGAIAQLGGAKGLQAMLVESVTNDKLANQARFSVSGDERMDKTELKSLAANLSENASAGAFSQEDWLKTIKNVGTITGQQKGLDKETLTFLGQFANVGGMDVEKSGDIFGHLKAQNKTLSNEDITDIMLSGHAVGQAGSFNISEIPDAHKLMQLKGSLGGMSNQDKYQNLFAIGSLVKEGGAGSLETAGVQYQTFLKQAETAAKHGDTHFQFNQAHQLMNATSALEYAINTPSSQQSKYLNTGRSRNFISNLSSQVSERAGVDKADFSPEAKRAREKVIEDLLRTGMSLEEFQKEVERSITPQEKFKAAFNKISNNLEAEFLPIMEQMVPIVDAFAAKLVEKGPEIGDFMLSLVAWLSSLVDEVPNVIDILIGLGGAVKDAISFVMSLTGHASNLDEAKAKEEETASQLARANQVNDPAWQKSAKEAHDKAVIDTAFYNSVNKLPTREQLRNMANKKKEDMEAEEEETVAKRALEKEELAQWHRDYDKPKSQDNSVHEEHLEVAKKQLHVIRQLTHELAPQPPPPPTREQ